MQFYNLWDDFYFSTMYALQTSANWGPDSRFVLEASFKLLMPKSSGSSVMITLNCVHKKNFTHVYMYKNVYNSLFNTKDYGAITQVK